MKKEMLSSEKTSLCSSGRQFGSILNTCAFNHANLPMEIWSLCGTFVCYDKLREILALGWWEDRRLFFTPDLHTISSLGTKTLALSGFHQSFLRSHVKVFFFQTLLASSLSEAMTWASAGWKSPMLGSRLMKVSSLSKVKDQGSSKSTNEPGFVFFF